MKNSAFLLSGQLLLFHSMKAIMKGLMSTKFWDGVTTQEIDTLYFSAVPTPERVTQLLEIVEKSQTEAKVTTWLHRYIGNTKLLKEFVRFVTGAESITLDNPIRVEFINSQIEPLPSSKTCFCILYLPRTFRSYFHLEKNFDKV